MARVGLTVLCAIQAVAQPAIDLNSTHATHPQWPGHARFHVVWQSLQVSLLSAVAIALVWMPTADSARFFYVAIVLAALSPIAFLVTFACRCLFHGTLSDPGGIPSWRFVLAGRPRSLDLNLVAVLASLAVLLFLTALFAS